MKENFLTDKQVAIRTWFSFLFFIIAFTAGIAVWFWLKKQPADRRTLGGIPHPLRKGLNVNERFFSTTFNANRLVPVFPKSSSANPARVNGDIGMSNDFDPAQWKLAVVKSDGDTLLLNLDDIKKLPKTEIVFNFKCIEGWSQKTWWGGVKFSDFLKHYNLNKEANLKYVGLSTPDEEYYVGIDMPSAMHEQTLLCYELNGEPLPMNQGYPLRLIIPVKYGIKSIKRIGTMYFSNQRPPDYWAERGYDYYSGL
jgi:DMSO/TMAO reductase YedYZ molybdopterin-dependent catalytic subunit